jgi:hypothetical protein
MPLRVVKLIHMRSCETLCAMPNMLVIFYIRLGDVYLSKVMCLSVFSITLYLPWLVYDASSIAFLYIFIHMHCCTSFRYASWNAWRTWGGANLKMVFGGSIPKMEGSDKCQIRRCSPSGFHLTNSNLSRIPGKPWSIISLLHSKQLILYMLYVLLH